MPSSSATARRLRPLACARRTASARNSSVKCFLSSAIGDLLLHGKSSPLLRSKSNPDLFQPYGGFPDGVKVENGHIVMPELPGIGFEGKSDLIKVMRELAE